MRIGHFLMVCVLILFTLQNSPAVQSEKYQNHSQEVIFSQTLARAPYFEARLNLYLARLAVESEIGPVVTEFCRELMHLNPELESSQLYWSMGADEPTVQSFDHPAAVNYDSESGDLQLNSVVSNCWNVSAAVSAVSKQILVVWQDERNGVDDPDIWGQILDLNFKPKGGNIKLHTANAAAQIDPSVAATSDGGFVVVWEDYRDSGPAIFFRKFNASLNASGPETRVDPASTKTQFFPVVTADQTGFFTVTWFQSDAEDFNIYCSRLSNAGAFSGGFLVNDDEAGKLQWSPAIASLPSGQTMIVWEDKRNDNSDIYAQRIKSDGTKQGGNFLVTDSKDPKIQFHPFIAAGATQFVACWEDDPSGKKAVAAQWFNNSMLKDGSNKRIDDNNPVGLKEYPVATFNSNNETLFAWQDSRNGHLDLYAQKMSATRQPLQFLQIPVAQPAGDQSRPQILVNDDEVMLCWLNLFLGEKGQNVFGNQYDWISLPVELAGFSARCEDENIVLQWATASEIRNYGFEVQRSKAGGDFVTIAFVNGHGTSSVGHFYTYTDPVPAPGRYVYRLKQIDDDGAFSYSGTVETLLNRPSEFALEQNYPNPFNPKTVIQFAVPSQQHVRLWVFDITGKERLVLLDEEVFPGQHAIPLDASHLPSGTFFYRLESAGFSLTRKMLYLK